MQYPVSEYTAAKLVEKVWTDLTKKDAYPAGRPRGLGFAAEDLGGELRITSADIPYLAYQYDGGTIAQAHAGLRETDRSVVYVIWHNSLHEAEILERRFLDALLKTKRISAINPIFSFRDSSTGRAQLATPHGIQRDVLIRI